MGSKSHIPGYTGVRASKPAAPYEAYHEDLAAISTALNSSLSGPAVYATPAQSSTQEQMAKTAAAWQQGFQPDRTFHTRGSPEKSLIEAELKRRTIERTRREGLNQTK